MEHSVQKVWESSNVVRLHHQSYATASFEQHSLLATINVVRSIVAAAVQPAYAKVSDVFGRFTILIFSIIVYLVGASLFCSQRCFAP